MAAYLGPGQRPRARREFRLCGVRWRTCGAECDLLIAAGGPGIFLVRTAIASNETAKHIFGRAQNPHNVLLTPGGESALVAMRKPSQSGLRYRRVLSVISCPLLVTRVSFAGPFDSLCGRYGLHPRRTASHARVSLSQPSSVWSSPAQRQCLRWRRAPETNGYALWRLLHAWDRLLDRQRRKCAHLLACAVLRSAARCVCAARRSCAGPSVDPMLDARRPAHAFSNAEDSLVWEEFHISPMRRRYVPLMHD